MIWTVLYPIILLIAVGALGEGVLAIVDWHRRKYGRFVGVNFRKQWM